MRDSKTLFFLMSAAWTFAACSSDPTGPSANVPASHSVVKGGAWHEPALNNATQFCTSCHGPDLRGGTNGEPSCYTCHGKEWS